MDVCCSVIWLLIGVVFVVQLPVTRGQLCPPDWTFHALTVSCMALVRKYFTYREAIYYCEDNFRSSTMKRDGHLVFIFDQATDEFVKGFLGEQRVDRALIGLHDRARNGDYAWGDVNTIAAVYMGWADNPHTPDSSKNAVVTTKDGWQEYDGRSAAYFVCQVSVDFPTPRMVCPVAEVGQESPDIRCTTDTHQSLSITGVRFMKSAAVVASCDANRCWPGLRYGQVVDVSKPPETRSSASWTLKLRNVTISDATGWTCSVEFSNSGYWVASQPCSLIVYRKPADIQCSQRFVQQKAAMITCTAAQVYPQVNCTWKVNYLTRKVTVSDQTVSNVVTNDDGHYRATCTAYFNVNNAGTYNVTVVMVVTLPNFRTELVKETSVSVAPPQQPPLLYLVGQILQSSWVEVVENQTLTLTCRVPGGDPQVYRTFITCDYIPQPFESDGSLVTMNVRVTREFNGRSCTCSALHAATYTQTSSVEIRVAYPVIPVSENGGSPVGDVGATVVGVVAAVLVIVIIFVIICLLKRKGAPCKREKHETGNTPMQDFKQADYMNDEPGSRHGLEEVPDAQDPEDSNYEKIIDFRSDMPDNPVQYPHQMLLNAGDGDVEYENAVSGL